MVHSPLFLFDGARVAPAKCRSEEVSLVPGWRLIALRNLVTDEEIHYRCLHNGLENKWLFHVV
jgi:hypothetical protein